MWHNLPVKDFRVYGQAQSYGSGHFLLELQSQSEYRSQLMNVIGPFWKENCGFEKENVGISQHYVDFGQVWTGKNIVNTPTGNTEVYMSS